MIDCDQASLAAWQEHVRLRWMRNMGYMRLQLRRVRGKLDAAGAGLPEPPDALKDLHLKLGDPIQLSAALAHEHNAHAGLLGEDAAILRDWFADWYLNRCGPYIIHSLRQLEIDLQTAHVAVRAAMSWSAYEAAVEPLLTRGWLHVFRRGGAMHTLFKRVVDKHVRLCSYHVVKAMGKRSSEIYKVDVPVDLEDAIHALCYATTTEDFDVGYEMLKTACSHGDANGKKFMVYFSNYWMRPSMLRTYALLSLDACVSADCVCLR